LLLLLLLLLLHVRTCLLLLQGMTALPSPRWTISRQSCWPTLGCRSSCWMCCGCQSFQ
jgi:hypothetical protein